MLPSNSSNLVPDSSSMGCCSLVKLLKRQLRCLLVLLCIITSLVMFCKLNNGVLELSNLATGKFVEIGKQILHFGLLSYRRGDHDLINLSVKIFNCFLGRLLKFFTPSLEIARNDCALLLLG